MRAGADNVHARKIAQFVSTLVSLAVSGSKARLIAN